MVADVSHFSPSYETMHTFFKTIGNINMSLLREVSIHLYDATPTDMPHSQPEDRRYIYDRQLLGIVKLLAENTNLRKVQVIVDGTLSDLQIVFVTSELTAS